MRKVPDKNCRENQNTHFMFNKGLFENRTVCETMWKRSLEWGRPHIAIRRMRISHFISKAIYIHTHARTHAHTHTHTHTHTQNVSHFIRTLPVFFDVRVTVHP